MKRIGYALQALISFAVLMTAAIIAPAVVRFLWNKEKAVIARTHCGPMHCPRGATAEFPVYGAGAVIVGIIALLAFIGSAEVLIGSIKKFKREQSRINSALQYAKNERARQALQASCPHTDMQTREEWVSPNSEREMTYQERRQWQVCRKCGFSTSWKIINTWTAS